MSALKRLIPPLVIALLALGAFQWKIHQKMADFGVYRQAAGRALNAEPLYRESDSHFQYKYLPVFAIATIPFAELDVDAAKAIWFAMSVGALVLLLRFSALFVPDRRRALPMLIGFTFLFMAKFATHELQLGQVNLVFGLLAVSAIGALQSDLPSLAGALFAASVIVKPYGIIFAPWLAASADRRATIALVVGIALALVLPAFVYGFGGNIALLRAWWHTVSSTTGPNLMGSDNVSFAAMWSKWLGIRPSARVMASLTSVACLALVLDAWRRRAAVNEPAYLEAAALLLLIPLLSPQGWDYVLLLAIPAVALLLDRLPELPRAWQVQIYAALGVMGFVSFDLVGRAAYARFMGLSAITICAVAVLYALTELRRRSLA